MKIYLTMTRQYETLFEIEASCEEEALMIFERMGSEKYAAELEQCCVVDEQVNVLQKF